MNHLFLGIGMSGQNAKEEIKEQVEDLCCGTCGCQSACAVMPKIDDLLSKFISDKTDLFKMVEAKGSPLNIVFPEMVLANRSAFQQVLTKRGIKGTVFFTSKPNKSRAIMSALSLDKANVDVSSEGALLHALSCGVSGDLIQASGPKSIDYLYLALMHRALISVDSEFEMELIKKLTSSNLNLPQANILVRICSLKAKQNKFSASDIPFGIRVESMSGILTKILESTQRIKFQGIHFHVLGGDMSERLVAFENAIESIRLAYRQQLQPKIINIGGGFKVRFAAERSQWHKFQSYIRESLLGKSLPITWNGTAFGLRVEAGRIAGSVNYPDHYPDRAGSEELDDFLNMRSALYDDCSVSEILRDMMLELYVEPGRALLDQAGITVAEVSSVKISASGQNLLMLNINHSNLLSREHKLLTQPVFVARGPRKASTDGYYLFGNLCIGSDLIQYQKVYPGFVPEAGDLVVFINTAGYLMDFVESEVLHQKTARKLATFLTKDGFITQDDENTGPASIMKIRQRYDN